MKIRLVHILSVCGLAALAACSSASQTGSLPRNPAAPAIGSLPIPLAANVAASCSQRVSDDDQVSCLALMRTDVGAAVLGTNPGAVADATRQAHSGYGPADIQSAYKLPATGSGQTVAIVDAYNDPNAEADLGTYRSYYGLSACTTANGCFKKVSQTGTTRYPRSDVGWAQEISLDVDMVSAACPNCKIILVEASTASFANLGAGVVEAMKLGANAISNSYGGGESNSYNKNYDAPANGYHAIVTASSGDSGYGAQSPASYGTVIAVGGTNLQRAGNARGWSETAWSGAGSGCSAYVSKPSYQHDSGCSRRTEADTSAVADPNSGVAVYDSYGSPSGWLVFGGTSASSPIIASVYALAGNASTVSTTYGNSLYTHTANFFDVTSGSNGSCGNYICNAGPGYDGPTGLGTPNGTAAF